METILPDASSQSFWLKGLACQFPNFENANTFVDAMLVRCMQAKVVAPCTLRYRFAHATGRVTLEVGTYTVEWFSVNKREAKASDKVTVNRASAIDFTAPFTQAGPAVLYLKQE
jgi:hypothetical protein